ncbi:MAG TPA: hypothetical protein VJI12_03020 [archaeon]|nr:hypothetical protein [archaeon]
MQIFWGNMPAYFHVPHLGVFFEMAAKAFDITIGKDPNMTKSRTRQLVSNLRDMDNYAKDWIHEKRIDANFYKSALNHVVFSLVEDEIAQRFEGLKDTDLKPFEETTRRLIELNASLERTKCK